MTPHRQRCETCKKIGTENCPYDVELYNRDGCDEIPRFRRDILILSLDEISDLCGLQCHSSAQPAQPSLVGKTLVQMHTIIDHGARQPSSEPKSVTINDGSDRDWRLISMYELQKLEHAINEECVGKNDGCPPGHLKEMHDSGNEVIDKVRLRPAACGPEEPSYQELVDFARWTQTFWRHGIEIMRKNNLVIKTDAPMEKLAFTFYMDLCEIDSRAKHLFQEGYREENYKNESAIVSRTITGYPRPYEQRIRSRVLDDVITIINMNCFEMEGKRLRITPLLLCQEIDSLRSKP